MACILLLPQRRLQVHSSSYLLNLLANYFLIYLRKAILIYDDMIKKPDYKKELHLFKACCLYAICAYEEAKREVNISFALSHGYCIILFLLSSLKLVFGVVRL